MITQLLCSRNRQTTEFDCHFIFIFSSKFHFNCKFFSFFEMLLSNWFDPDFVCSCIGLDECVPRWITTSCVIACSLGELLNHFFTMIYYPRLYVFWNRISVSVSIGDLPPLGSSPYFLDADNLRLGRLIRSTVDQQAIRGLGRF